VWNFFNHKYLGDFVKFSFFLALLLTLVGIDTTAKADEVVARRDQSAYDGNWSCSDCYRFGLYAYSVYYRGKFYEEVWAVGAETEGQCLEIRDRDSRCK
jgi:hypothetical protein